MIEPRWMNEKRSKALARFEKMELPKEREEEWRYTMIKEPDFSGAESEVSMDGGSKDIIFTDFLSALSEHPDIIKKYLGRTVSITDKFSAFHYANISNGIVIFVPDYKTARLSAKITGSSHTIIVTGKGSSLQYTEEYNGGGFATDAVEIFAGEKSTIDFLSIQNCDKSGSRFSFKGIDIERGGSINMSLLSTGATFHRTKIDSTLEGEDAKTELLCGFAGRERQHLDFMINSRHAVPNTSSSILARGVLYDASTSVFRGKIDIEKGAQKTDSYLEDHVLIMGEDAVSNSIPSLKIDANDVRASHGATVGRVDDEQLFYLESRGLTREKAEKLIVDGFFSHLLSRIRDAGMREAFRKAVNG